VLEEFRHEEELRLQMERHRQWEQDEVLAQQHWEERQERLAQAREEKAKQEVNNESFLFLSAHHLCRFYSALTETRTSYSN
jgi:hypothetical protein